MAWSIRKSLRILPGVRLNLSKEGPRLSFGIRGVRASVGPTGKARVYGGLGPVRFQKRIDLAKQIAKYLRG